MAIVVAVVLVSSLLASSSRGQEIAKPVFGTKSWTTSWQQATSDASEQNVPVMLVFAGSDWCPWSQKMSEEIVDTNDFYHWYDGRMIPMLVDFPRSSELQPELAKQNQNLLQRYREHLSGFPTVLFVRSDGTVIGKLGYEPGGLNAWLQKAQQIVGVLDKST